MNETQWLFEHESINIEDERKYEELALMAGAAKKAVIHMLGLNVLPIQDEETGRLRMREDHEIVPLLPTICREGIAAVLAESINDMNAQDEALAQIEEAEISGSDMSVDEFLEFMDGGDMQTLDSAEVQRLAVVNSPEYSYISDNIVKRMSDKDKKEFEELFGVAPEQSVGALKEVASTLSKTVKIDPEDGSAPDVIIDPPQNKRRLQITIEPEDE
jgi:hypothetical protein